MKIMLNANGIEVPGERKLLERFQRAGKRQDGRAYSSIAVKNAAGVLRLRVWTHTEREEDSVVTLLENAGFNDELVVEREEVDGEAGVVECRVEVETHPEFQYIFSLAPPRVVSVPRPAAEDPGPDPSWLEFYAP